MFKHKTQKLALAASSMMVAVVLATASPVLAQGNACSKDGPDAPLALVKRGAILGHGSGCVLQL